MKTSRYNMFFEFQEQIVGYNAFENDYIFITRELYDLFLKCERNGIDSLATIHPDFFDLLKEKNFCIPNNIDELQQVKDLVHSIDCNPEYYQIVINPTMNCNFNCWYCYETHIKGSKMDKKIIQSIQNHIKNKLNEGVIKEFSINWFGGEPLLYFNEVVLPILEFSNKLSEEKCINFYTHFTTNGSLINNEILEHCKRLGNSCTFQITLDGHRYRHNQVRNNGAKTGSYDVIIANIKKCLDYGFNINCRINLSDETFNDDLLQIIEDFSDLQDTQKQLIFYSLHKVWQVESNLDSEIKNLLKEFKNRNMNVGTGNSIDTVRNSCYGDKKNQATINFNGDVYKCTARDFKPENREGVLMDDGTIEWNDKYYQRMESKFNNPPCLACNILPICNGSCTQHALENIGKDYCVHDFDENKKIDIIREKLLSAIN